jgi:plasmid stabilization system protein ParE
MAHRVAPQVHADLDDIWFNIVRESGGNVAAADRVINSITERFALLSQYPRFGRTREHDLRPGYRSTPVGEYTIIYTIGDGDEVLILYVFPSRRDIPNLLDPTRSS